MKMKSIITGSLAALLALSISSCSTSVDIAKRSFNKGYYIHVSKKNKVVESAQETVARVETKNIKPVAVVDEKVELNRPEALVMASVNNKPEVRAVKHIETIEVPAITSFEAPTEYKKAEIRTLARDVRKEIRSNAFNMRGDAPAIVFILLCIFLPFIAVGIKDDWGTRFLLDILLCLLFWIPGVIYAFIVCFG